MNSVIEAQEQFTECFGELTLRDLCNSNLVLPIFSNEAVELDQFIADHQAPALVKFNVIITQFPHSKHYNFY